jgi:hypothetical protein
VRTPRTAYSRVSEAWNVGDVCNLEVDSYNPGTSLATISFDPAPGSTDHTMYYGPLSSVSSYGYSASETGLGATGSSSVTLPCSDSWFWLVVGRNNGEEGGYGTGIAERPPSPAAAVPQDPNRTGLCSTP